MTYSPTAHASANVQSRLNERVSQLIAGDWQDALDLVNGCQALVSIEYTGKLRHLWGVVSYFDPDNPQSDYLIAHCVGGRSLISRHVVVDITPLNDEMVSWMAARLEGNVRAYFEALANNQLTQEALGDASASD